MYDNSTSINSFTKLRVTSGGRDEPAGPSARSGVTRPAPRAARLHLDGLSNYNRKERPAIKPGRAIKRRRYTDKSRSGNQKFILRNVPAEHRWSQSVGPILEGLVPPEGAQVPAANLRRVIRRVNILLVQARRGAASK
ncbi:hypothetical protein EVAR_65828_1 [Eumeta japonica]|uniref:Uncharacterized protein n=1 Tax=Eumeta variegata TaxID=151549 RepID=A0A4C1ZQK6_EUMVA|nr:hypothetical protein EVAR_65828_1 [Eumeta japonica]